MTPYLHGKVFRRSVIEKAGISFNEKMSMGEDSLFIKQYLSAMKQGFVQSEDVAYFYTRDNENSLSRKYYDNIYDLCEYYRLIRNSAVHDLCEVNDHIKEYKKLQRHDFKVEAKFAKLSAPNEYDNISFDDFIMFARSSVELATYLFDHISYDYKKIVLDVNNSQKAVWKRYTKERREKAILAYINTLFTVDDTLDVEVAYLADII